MVKDAKRIFHLTKIKELFQKAQFAAALTIKYLKSLLGMLPMKSRDTRLNIAMKKLAFQ
jgi:hypothetical protein